MSYQPVLDYITAFWPKIIRQQLQDEQTRIGLPKPYIVPGNGEMFQEMYYWDSFFEALGVVGTEYEHLVMDMTENMLYLFNRFGVIPNGSRYYFLSRSQPPLLNEMIWLSYNILVKKDKLSADAFLASAMQASEREHETVWHGTEQPHKRLLYRGLSRYYDINVLDMLASCESGWDHSTRCDDRWLEHLPVDLNAMLYRRECDYERVATMQGDTSRAESWAARAAKRRETMIDLMWDGGQGFFFDYDVANKTCNTAPSLAGFYPLWAKLATPEQAARIVRDWLPRFEFPGGLVTTLDSKAGRQWAYPNGWAPLNWIVTEGLANYGFNDEAQRIRRAWCDNCAAVFTETGAMWEKYNVVQIGGKEEGGLYGSVRGFGWSNGVFVDFARKLEAE
ncbi:MAG: trehalase family glycosidase [Chloroflexota bacterium]